MQHSQRIILIALIASLLLYPLFLRLNLAASSYDYFDIIYMLPSYAWLYLFWLCFLLSAYVFVTRKIGLLVLIVTMLVMYTLFSASQYSAVFYIDVFLHGATAQTALSGASHSSESYLSQWPMSFTYWASVSRITGLDVIQTNMLLTFVFQMGICILLYVMGRIVLGETLSGLPGVLLLVTNIYFDGDLQIFSPQLFGLALFLLVLLILLKKDLLISGKKTYALFTVILLMDIVVSHAITSFYLFFALFGIILIIKRERSRIAPYLAIFTLMLAFWWVSIDSPSLKLAIGYFVKTLSSPFLSKLTRTATTPLSLEPLPFLGFVLRNYYFKPLLVIAFVIVALSFLFKRKSLSLFHGVFLGIALGSIFFLLSPTDVVATQVSRVLLFLLIPSCYLVSLLVKQLRPGRRFAVSILVLLLIVPSFLSMMTYTSEYEQLSHSWEQNAYVFLADHRNSLLQSSMMIGTDSLTAMYYAYYDPSYKRTSANGLFDVATSNLTQWLGDSSTIYDASIIIRSFRQESTYTPSLGNFSERSAFWQTFDQRLEQQLKYDPIYSDGLIRIYARGTG